MKGSEIFAAIDIGAHSIKMRIVQVDQNGKSAVLEDVRKHIRIGKDVFTFNTIERETIEQAVDCLMYYKRLMKDYGVVKYRALATSAIREAKNGLFIADQIRLKTGIDIEIVDESIEKYLTYKSIKDQIKNYDHIRIEGALLLEVGSGSCEINLYKGKRLVRNDEIKIGPMRLKNVISDLESKALYLPGILEEYVYAVTENIHKFIKGKNVKHFIAVGGDIKNIYKMLEPQRKENTVSKEKFKELYKRILSDDKDIKKQVYDMNLDGKEILSSMIIFNMFFDLTEADKIIIPDISLREGAIADMIDEMYRTSRYYEFNNDIVYSAKNIAKRYKSSVAHITVIERIASEIFESVYKNLGLEERDKLLLRVSAVLHEVGKFTRIKNYENVTFDQIRNLTLLGITAEEMKLIAYITLCSSELEYHEKLETSTDLNDKDKLRVLKLSMIQAFADTLDKSKKQKIRVVNIKSKPNKIIIQYTKTMDITLELWGIEKIRDRFRSVTGLDIKLEES